MTSLTTCFNISPQPTMSPRKDKADTDGTLLLGAVPGEQGLGAHCKSTEKMFLGKKTYAIYGCQPPFWYPRTTWPDLPSQSNSDSNTSNDQADHTAKPIEWRRSDDATSGRSWEKHCQQVNNFLEAMISATSPTLSSLEAMEEIMLRGIENAVGVVHSEIRIRGYPKPTSSPIHQQGLRLPSEFETTGMDILNNVPFEDQYRKKLFGRRFWAVKFQFVSNNSESSQNTDRCASRPNVRHLATALFDRRSSTFIYFDTNNQHRGTRAKAAGLAWRVFLANVQLPYEFYLCSPPLTEQPSEVDSAYLSFFMLYQSVRSHVGQDLNGLFETSTKKLTVLFDGKRCKTRPSLTCDIRIRDWGALGDTPAQAFGMVGQLMTAICLHELGIVCRRPLLEHQWLRTINLNRYRTSDALETLADSIDFGGAVPVDVPDAGAHARGHVSKRMFERRTTAPDRWYVLPPFASFITSPPVADVIPVDEVESLWKERNEGTMPPEIYTMQRGDIVNHEEPQFHQLPSTAAVKQHDKASPAKHMKLADIWCRSTTVTLTLDSPPWCPTGTYVSEWRSIWADLVSAGQSKAADC